MPMSNYDIANYVLGLLDKINFYDGKDELDSDLINQFVTKSIGGNPRSIKRLINSLALIKILNDKDLGGESDGVIRDKDEAMVMFAMVCLQIAHPEIYQLFADNPNFREWNEDLAYRETQKKEEADKNWTKNFEQAKNTDNFNEDWEQCLFRVCYTNPRRRAKASAISEFISIFDEQFNQKEIISMIESALGIQMLGRLKALTSHILFRVMRHGNKIELKKITWLKNLLIFHLRSQKKQLMRI